MCPQLCPGRAQGSWQALPELFTAPSLCLLLVHPQLQTSLTCCFHLSLSPSLQNISLQTVKWIPPGVQGHPASPMHAPILGASLDLQSCPPHPAASLFVPSWATCPCAIARSSRCPVAPLAGDCMSEQVFHEITEHPGRSQPISSPPAGVLHSLYTSQAAAALHLSAPGVSHFLLVFMGCHIHQHETLVSQQRGDFGKSLFIEAQLLR